VNLNAAEAAVLRDNIAPVDVGRVAGAVLVDQPMEEGEEKGKHIIYLLGPQISTEKENVKAIERVYRKEIKITERNVEHKQYLLGLGLPEILANYISFAVDEDYRGGGALYSEPFYSMAVKNIKKYSGYKPISFE